MGGAELAAVAAGGSLLLVYFCFTIMPISLELAGLRLSPLRVLLLVLFVPYMLKIIRGEAGKFTIVDGLIIAHSAWIFLSLVVVHGAERIPFAGITMVELVGGYLVGRVLIRDAAAYQRMVRLLLGTMIFLLPFALIELLTGRLVIPEIVGKVFQTIYRGNSAVGRMGLERVYAVFEHPILYGMFCSIAIANLYYGLKSGVFWRILLIGFTVAMTFMSLSSAPLLSCGLQALLIVWDRITKGKWKLFLILAVIGYVTIDSLSNRTPITILIETLTFNSGTGWTRIAIFEFGILNAYDHPIFGIGFNDWVRPHWLTASVDNFWLLTTMRYGFVGVAFLIGAFLMHFYKLMRAAVVNPAVHELRTGYGITLAAICFTMITVHVWGAVYVFVMFYLGAGSWFYTSEAVGKEPEDDALAQETGPAPASRYTRFPAKNRNTPPPAPTRRLTQ
jgi:hypothetical protein